MTEEFEVNALELKRQLQEAVAKKYAGLTPEEARQRRQDELLHGEDAVSKWWRSLPTGLYSPAGVEGAVREENEPYR